MAYFSFTKLISEMKSINIFNNGDMMRDFTYIDDIVEGVKRIMEIIPKGNSDWSGMKPDPSSSKAPYKIYNIGNNNPVKLLDFVKVIENELGIEGNKKFLPMQAGDVYATFADVDDIAKDTGFRPYTSIEDGMKKFIAWYKGYYKV
jgi:UDP-glucuronate 4-epimerase